MLSSHQLTTPDKSVSPSALEGHGLTPEMLKLGMAWLW